MFCGRRHLHRCRRRHREHESDINITIPSLKLHERGSVRSRSLSSTGAVTDFALVNNCEPFVERHRFFWVRLLQLLVPVPQLPKHWRRRSIEGGGTRGKQGAGLHRGERHASAREREIKAKKARRGDTNRAQRFSWLGRVNLCPKNPFCRVNGWGSTLASAS